MWLLHTSTFELRQFPSQPPRYAILSHCWDESEVTFTDMLDIRHAKTLPGWLKILFACTVARNLIEWIWIDTCCIDKSSSAELSEAINSMFAWYRGAAHCLAYLGDVDASEDPRLMESTFRKSRWFTRGWTLQELIAPPDGTTFSFLSKDWRLIGNRQRLAVVISAITRIDTWVLRRAIGPQRQPSDILGGYSVAKRMSWAAQRKTTRAEDRAYSLMGLFDVNMPVLYGEGGDRAFHRLQLEIIRQFPDHSIFAWNWPSVRSDPLLNLLPRAASAGPGSRRHRWPPVSKCPLLASSPDNFLLSADLHSMPSASLTASLRLPVISFPEFYDTNHGIRIQLPLFPLETSRPESRLFCAILACYTSTSIGEKDLVGLVLRRQGGAATSFECVGGFHGHTKGHCFVIDIPREVADFPWSSRYPGAFDVVGRWRLQRTRPRIVVHDIYIQKY